MDEKDRAEGFRENLPQPSFDRRAGEPVLHARPLKGEIDHAALSREIIARFPKILAELAK